jgi:hypothetical protein
MCLPGRVGEDILIIENKFIFSKKKLIIKLIDMAKEVDDLQIKFNLQGLLKEVNLPVYKALWPLFETIVNSIQSIEDSQNKKNGEIRIIANRISTREYDLEGNENEAPFEGFIVKDNGEGFTEQNYNSFCVAYSNLKIAKGCKGIGRFLWLKAFKSVHVNSVFSENGCWAKRSFNFSALNGVDPDNNIFDIENEEKTNKTIIKLDGFLDPYKKNVPVSLDALGKRIIEHCLPYFLLENCPHIVLQDSEGYEIVLNDIFNTTIKESLHQDEIQIKNRVFKLYHIRMYNGANKHELHFCANSREVKSYDLSQYISDLQKRLVEKNGNKTFYYLGFFVGDYLNENVNSNRTAFNWESNIDLYSDNISEKEMIDVSQKYIELYLQEEIEAVKRNKRDFIKNFIEKVKPQYRYLLKQKPELYREVPANLSEENLELELHKATQRWELELSQKAVEIESQIKKGEFTQKDFSNVFNNYCQAINDISKSSLAEYVIRRKSILDLLERALQKKDDGSYFSEATLHSIICPMHVTSDDISFDEMNLWVIDDRLSYHSFLASDKQMKSLPIISSESDKRMDLAIFDNAISFAENQDVLNSISIIEFKKPNRDNLKDDDKNPINQVLGYVKNIRDGVVKKASGRPFNNVSNTAFYCYIIVDLTDSLRLAAENATLTLTPDGEGYFGYNPIRHAYIEVISYDKLLKDAKQRNQILFDKLFSPNILKTLNGRLLDETKEYSGKKVVNIR